MFGSLELLDKAGNACHLNKYDVVLLYFSAHWCPPCRAFTPLLRTFYESLPPGSVKVVFVSRDHEKKEFDAYFQQEHGNWLATKFETNSADALAKQ